MLIGGYTESDGFKLLQCLVRMGKAWNSVPFNQLLDYKTSKGIPWVPASAVLPLEATWFHSSTQVDSKISQIWFEILGAWLKRYAVVFSGALVLLFHKKTLMTYNVIPRQASCLIRATSSAACNFNF